MTIEQFASFPFFAIGVVFIKWGLNELLKDKSDGYATVRNFGCGILSFFLAMLLLSNQIKF